VLVCEYHKLLDFGWCVMVVVVVLVVVLATCIDVSMVLTLFLRFAGRFWMTLLFRK
jgi:hypothetical protein